MYDNVILKQLKIKYKQINKNHQVSIHPEIHSASMRSRQLYLLTWPSLLKFMSVSPSSSPKKSLAPTEPFGEEGCSCHQGISECMQGRKRCWAGKQDPSWRLELMQRLRGSREEESGSKATNTEGRTFLGQRGKDQILLLFRKYQDNGTETQKFQSTGTEWAAYKTLHFCSFYSLL